MHFVGAQVFGAKELSTCFSVSVPQAETDSFGLVRSGLFFLECPPTASARNAIKHGHYVGLFVVRKNGWDLTEWVANHPSSRFGSLITAV